MFSCVCEPSLPGTHQERRTHAPQPPPPRHDGHSNESLEQGPCLRSTTTIPSAAPSPPPPKGTGKTTTVVALVREAVARGWRCLVCAPSNVAVDGILERLVAAEADGGSDGDGTGGGGGGGGHGGRKHGGRPRVVRMGHPARLLPQVM